MQVFASADSVQPPDRGARLPEGLKRVAVIGAGISGLGAAYALKRHGGFAVSLFERESTFGGHAHTVDLRLPGRDGRLIEHGVDTGFLVYNERTYPELIRLFAELGVETALSDMSFSVQLPGGLTGRSSRLEWNGSTLDTVFAQRRNLFSPRFFWMLKDILRFNRLATEMATSGSAEALAEPLGEFLDRHRFGDALKQGYLLPMIACIWSCPQDQMLRFPVSTLIRFCHNHGLLQVENRPAWHTVRGGSRHYVDAIIKQLPDARASTPVLAIERTQAGVLVRTESAHEHFDAVVMACHAPQTLRLLGDGASPQERVTLGALRTQRNRAVLHTDVRVLPDAPKAWAAWNFERAQPDQAAKSDSQQVCLHYWINKLQPVPFEQPVVVSLNPLREPDPRLVHGEYDWEHPVFDARAIQAQSELERLQGQQQTWFCGAWCGYGFHEDGLRAGMKAAQGVIDTLLGAHAHVPATPQSSASPLQRAA